MLLVELQKSFSLFFLPVEFMVLINLSLGSSDTI